MQSKRGQVTVFIIIGIIIVIAVAVFLYLRAGAVPEEEFVSADIAPIKLYVEKCLEETAKDAVLDVASHGGYYNPPPLSGPFQSVRQGEPGPFIQLPYYFYNGAEIVPTKEQIENELTDYILNNYDQCVQVEEFTEKGYDIQISDGPEIQTTLTKKEVFFDINLPITIKIEDTEKLISDFSINFETSLLKLHSVATGYMEYQRSDIDAFFISRLMALAVENEITFNSFSYSDNDLVIALIDETILIENQPLIFAFAIKYPVLEEAIGIDFYIVPITEKQTATVGEEFSLQINAIGENVTYTLIEGIFNITSDGTITGTPSADDVGVHKFTVFVGDIAGSSDYTSFELEVSS